MHLNPMESHQTAINESVSLVMDIYQMLQYINAGIQTHIMEPLKTNRFSIRA
jgi:hypothetical protein